MLGLYRRDETLWCLTDSVRLADLYSNFAWLLTRPAGTVQLYKHQPSPMPDPGDQRCLQCPLVSRMLAVDIEDEYEDDWK